MGLLRRLRGTITMARCINTRCRHFRRQSFIEKVSVTLLRSLLIHRHRNIQVSVNYFYNSMSGNRNNKSKYDKSMYGGGSTEVSSTTSWNSKEMFPRYNNYYLYTESQHRMVQEHIRFQQPSSSKTTNDQNARR